MIDTIILSDVLAKYKANFSNKGWPDESFKWAAVKYFQDNWDVNATDFSEMFDRALNAPKIYLGLLASANNFPVGMLSSFAKAAPEEVRGMFIELFDESKDVVDRILSFKKKSDYLLEQYGNGAKQHYQYENAISTYLWLRFPDKYYIYKYSEVKSVAEVLHADITIKKGAYAANLRNFFKLYDELCVQLGKDAELKALLASKITDSFYPDPELRTLAIDIGFYISRYYVELKNAAANDEWFPMDYSPALSVEDWMQLIADESIFNTSSLEIMKRMKDYGGQATCKQLSVKYGGSINFYNSGSVSLAKRVAEKTGCPVMPRDEENANVIKVRFGEVEKQYFISKKYPMRPTFEDDEVIVEAMTDYEVKQKELDALKKKRTLI